tara:strand:- start:162940 stop:164262 length:1323 start_codon:yes stop_codon:yes gene_type:complete
MTLKYQRPLGAHAGQSSLSNRDKYQEDGAAQPKVSISSSKMDGDFNYIIDALNEIDTASGTKPTIKERLSVSLNDDGSLKASASSVMDDWIAHDVTGLSRVDNSTVMIDGDHVNIYPSTRRVKLLQDAAYLYASVEAASYSTGQTTLTFIDVVDAQGDVAVITTDVSALSYSPIMPGAIGNAIGRFNDLYVSALNVKSEGSVVVLNDTGASGKIYGLRSSAGNFEVVENTGTELAPIWVSRFLVNNAGFEVADESITTAKLTENAVTSPKLSATGVTAGTYNLATVTVDGKGRITSASEGSVPVVGDASTAVKGIVELATGAEVQTGTDIVRVPTVESLHSHQGIAKAWLRINGDPVTVWDSFNVSSVVDLGVGSYRVNLSITMGNTNYLVVSSSCNGSSIAGSPGAYNYNPTWFDIVNERPGSGNQDHAWISIAVLGDI